MPFSGGSTAAGDKVYVDITTTTGEVASPTFVQIQGVEGFSWSGFNAGEIEITPLEATQKSFLSNVPDPGKLAFSLYMDLANSVHAFILSVPTVRYNLNWKFETSAGSIYRFTGYLEMVGVTGAKGAANMAPVSVRVVKVYSVTP